MTPPELAVGDVVPALSLPDTGGEQHSLATPGEAPATVVCWTCNHCPYALAWQERLNAVATDYAGRGVLFLFVNSNDAERYPADSLDAMRARAEAGELAAPYLHDRTQDAARNWGAQKTPDIFVCDSDLVLRYRGAPDADHDDPSQAAAWLRSALDSVLAGEDPELPETTPVGCSIKWRP
jgi:hypothetical protein